MNPQLAEAWLGRGNILHQLGYFDQALAACDQALALEPDIQYGRGSRLLAKLRLCDWSNFEVERSQLMTAVRAGARACIPFTLLAIPSSPEDQLQCARLFAADEGLGSEKPLTSGRPRSSHRLRIAYLSADLRQHVIATVVAELFELHDRDRFEVLGISFGQDDRSELRGRLLKAFDRFHEVRSNTNRNVAELLHETEVDIAVDLMGHTQHSRLGILAHRPAPVQASYLGFPGTTGAEFIDYILTDPFVLPFDQQPFFTEKIVHLPDCYLPNDSLQRRISDRLPTRDALALPGDGFVFCAFTQTYKITPAMFDIWMRLLQAVEGAVLWLSKTSELAMSNLRREAAARGIDPARLVFAPNLDLLPDHLARLGQADLYLDTLPYNAHTSASNALWAGLPMLTCRGNTFASRVGASVLCAAGLPELVTDNLEEYEALALRIATDGELLRSVRRKLEANRATAPLFDTTRLCRHLETAYQIMWERCQRGEPPAGFSVPPIPCIGGTRPADGGGRVPPSGP